MTLSELSTALGDYRNLISALTAIFTFFSTLLWMAYVWITNRTFQEIKRQTDLASQAVLVVSGWEENISDSPNWVKDRSIIRVDKTDLKIEELLEKWGKIVEQWVPGASGEERIALIGLHNRGKSDIVSWKIDLHLQINAGPYLSKMNVSNDFYKFSIQSNSHDDTIPPGNTLQIVIGKIQAFPEANLVWDINYWDLTNDKKEIGHTQFHGDEILVLKNQFALQGIKPLSRKRRLDIDE